MIRAGIPERVAMMVSGHTTASVFERYKIVKDTDIRQAMQEAYLEAQMVTKWPQSAVSAPKKDQQNRLTLTRIGGPRWLEHPAQGEGIPSRDAFKRPDRILSL